MRNRFQKNKQALPSLRSRIKELKDLPARNILGAPWNYRTHPENQQEAIAASLGEIGFYDPLKVFRTDDMPVDCFMLVDGHARQELISDRIGPNTMIPCIITDLDEVEAKRALLTHDALGAMANSDKDKLDALLRTMETESQDMADMLEDLAKKAGCAWADESKQESTADSTPIPEKFSILIECQNEAQQAEMLARLSDEAEQNGFSVKSLIS